MCRRSTSDYAIGRAVHLLLDCPPDTLRCALTASRSSPAHRSVGTDDAIFRLSPNDLRWCYLRGLEYPSFAGLQGLVL